MKVFSMRSQSTLLAAAATLLTTASGRTCPPLGAVLPAPRSPSTSDAIRAAIPALEAALDAELGGLNMSAVSIGVKSIHEDAMLFSWHLSPPEYSGIGAETIDENTIYRVGSISKLMPVLAALQSCKIRMDDPVVKYLPELRQARNEDEIDAVAWDEVTVGALASHLAGLSTDTAQDLALFPAGPWTQMGLPDLGNGTGPTCSGLPGTVPCTGADLVRDMARRPPVYRAFTNPVYSNVGFALLGMVVASASNRTFEEVVRSSIFDVVGMPSTSFDGFPEAFPEAGFVPIGDTTWNATLGVYEAAGGMFSNTVDLLAFGDAILSNQLLPAAKTRRWLKPTADLTSLSSAVGAPWEISRSSSLTTDNRTVDVYTKSGDLGLYHGLLGLVADYDVVITVLTGGVEVSVESLARSLIFSVVAEAVLPALEAAGREEAVAGGLVGTFADEATNSTMTLAMDDGPGLVVTEFQVRGFDVLHNIDSYGLSGGGPANPLVEGRLYPSNRVVTSGQRVETAWRAVFDSLTEEEKAATESGLFYAEGTCVTWFGMDRSAYNFRSLADFVLVSGENGLVEVRNKAFGVTLTRT